MNTADRSSDSHAHCFKENGTMDDGKMREQVFQSFGPIREWHVT